MSAHLVGGCLVGAGRGRPLPGQGLPQLVRGGLVGHPVHPAVGRHDGVGVLYRTCSQNTRRRSQGDPRFRRGGRLRRQEREGDRREERPRTGARAAPQWRWTPPMGSGRWALVCVVGLARGRVLPPARRPRRPPASGSAAAAGGHGGDWLADAQSTIATPLRAVTSHLHRARTRTIRLF